MMYFFCKLLLCLSAFGAFLYLVLAEIMGGYDAVPQDRKGFYIIYKSVAYLTITVVAGFLMLDAKDKE
jgi:hypothetical protein